MDDCRLSGPVARQTLSKFLETGFETMADQVYCDGIRDEAYRGFYASLRMCDPNAFHAHAVELVALSATETLAGRLASLPIPACYVAGSSGGVGEQTRLLLQAAGVDVRILSPAGHVPFMDQPDKFIEVIISMAGRIRPG